MKIVRILGALVICGALLAPVTVSALSVWIQYSYSANPAEGNWWIPTSSSRPSMLGPWDAWEDAGKTRPLGNLYCIEPSVYEPAGGFHEHVYTPYSTSTWNPPNGGTNAGLQWATYLLLRVDPAMNTTSALKRAALQLAIWEALYDYDKFGDGYNDWDFTDGDFRINSLDPHGIATAEAVRAEAAAYLNAYRGQYGNGIVLHDGQDLLRLVPEPGTLALVGLGLALGSGMAFRRRRRA